MSVADAPTPSLHHHLGEHGSAHVRLPPEQTDTDSIFTSPLSTSTLSECKFQVPWGEAELNDQRRSTVALSGHTLHLYLLGVFSASTLDNSVFVFGQFLI